MVVGPQIPPDPLFEVHVFPKLTPKSALLAYSIIHEPPFIKNLHLIRVHNLIKTIHLQIFGWLLACNKTQGNLCLDSMVHGILYLRILNGPFWKLRAHFHPQRANVERTAPHLCIYTFNHRVQHIGVARIIFRMHSLFSSNVEDIFTSQPQYTG